MAKASANISIDADVKEQSLSILNQLGLDLSTAVGIFLRQTIRCNGLPFDVSLDVPGAQTKAVLEEIRQFKAHPDQYKRYASFRDALQEALSDA